MNLELNNEEATILKGLLGQLKTSDIANLMKNDIENADDVEVIEESIIFIYTRLKKEVDFFISEG